MSRRLLPHRFERGINSGGVAAQLTPDRRDPPTDATAVGDPCTACLIGEPVLHFCDKLRLRGGQALIVESYAGIWVMA